MSVDVAGMRDTCAPLSTKKDIPVFLFSTLSRWPERDAPTVDAAFFCRSMLFPAPYSCRVEYKNLHSHQTSYVSNKSPFPVLVP